MKKMLRILLIASCLYAKLPAAPLSDRTFLAQRDELSYRALEWTINNHYQTKKSNTVLGGTFTATPFYTESTNSADIARWFGIGKTNAIDVTTRALSGETLKADLSDALYSFNIDHSPNSDGATTGYIPMHGRLTLDPKRRAFGTYLSWDQSLENIAKGLRFSVQAPIVDVQASLRPNDIYATASHIPVTDGQTGATLRDYFSGNLRKGISKHSHVYQKELVRGKIHNEFAHAFGIADIKLRLDWLCYTHKRFNYSLGLSLQLPTGTTITNEYAFEPHVGARGHAAAGYNGLLQLHAYAAKNLTVRVDILGDVTYFFEGTERRMVSVYDLTDKVVMPASPYRLVMRNKYSGVQPAANVMSLDHTVKPGFQFDGLVGVSTQWNRWTIDIGYNFYWHQAEKLSLKNADAWSSDQYAFAHNHYSMYADALGTNIGGGNSKTVDGLVQHKGTVGREGDYNDRKAPRTKYQNLIGANKDGWGDPKYVLWDEMDGVGLLNTSTPPYPGAFTSMNGPIQATGKNSSGLIKQTVNADTGVGSNSTGTQAVRYTITSDYAATAEQITHSVVGGISYCFKGTYPVFIGIGGMLEVQESNRNSALENSKIWAKVGIQF
ncbi:MAG: hypothetical protein WCJ17_02820 [bacterium]